uniref:Uncharacterized protein n=1 Tax=Arundo donax TaxID=35708 RepID=A0A0A9A4N5_ARUDO
MRRKGAQKWRRGDAWREKWTDGNKWEELLLVAT